MAKKEEKAASGAFSVKAYSETEGTNYINSGIHVMEIAGVVGEEPEGKSPYIEFQLKSPNGEHKERLYFSEKAQKNSWGNLRHLVNKIITDAELENISSDSISEYAEKLSSAITGKKVRVVIVEKLSDNGKLYNRFKFPPFAESAAIAGDKSKLKFRHVILLIV